MEEDRKDAGSFNGPLANSQDLNDDSRTASYADSGHSKALARTLSPKASDQTSPQPRNFEFVLVTDNQSRRQVRRHAMRQHMHQRRLDSIARLKTTSTRVGGWVTREATSTSLSCRSQRLEEVQGCTQANSEISALDQGESTTDEETGSLPLVPASRPNNSTRPFDPLASPGAGGICDPFDSYPIPLRQADHELIQHYVVTYPSMMYNLAGSGISSPMLEIFRQLALHHRLAFQAMLAIASKHRTSVEGKSESIQSLTHKMRALRLMNQCIQGDRNPHDDGTIYAVATMAVIEKWSKDSSIEKMHFKGLFSMIRDRGGMRGLRVSSPFLEKILYWVDFSCAMKAMAGANLPWTGIVPDTPPSKFDFLVSDLRLSFPHTPGLTDAVRDHVRACEDFLGFFRRIRELEDIALCSHTNTVLPITFPRIKRFVPGTLLHSILTVLPDYDHGVRDVRFIDEYTSMACLLFLNAALYDSYANSSNFDWYLNWAHMEVSRLNQNANPSITSVLWILLKNGGYPNGEAGDMGERCWLVSRMLRVAKRLEWKCDGTVWDDLRKILIGFLLTQQECALCADHVSEEVLTARKQRRQTKDTWDENKMRKYILDIETSSLPSYF